VHGRELSRVVSRAGFPPREDGEGARLRGVVERETLLGSGCPHISHNMRPCAS
jgi:hypothetical protein